MKHAYCYDADGVFTGAEVAQESPLEPGVYLMPAQSTAVEPPLTEDGYHAVWTGETWDTRPVPVEPNVDELTLPDPDPDQIEREFALRESGRSKLIALGLSVDEVNALVGS